MPKGACTLYPGRTHCIACRKCKEEEDWAALRAAVCDAMLAYLREVRGCRAVTLEEQMDMLCDPARHVQR